MKKQNEPESGGRQSNLRLLIILVFNTVIIFGIYRIGILLRFEPILWIYFGVTLGMTLAYIFYNRGFSRRNLTSEMLPESWSAVQKQAFLDEDKKWREKSKWMLTILFPLIVTFFYEMVELFFLDNLKAIFPGLF